MKLIIILSSLLFLLSCENESLKIVTLNTTLPEVIPFIDAFNSEHKSIKIMINTSESSTKTGDLIIFRGQNDSSLYNLKKIDYLFEKQIDRQTFYEDLLNSVMNSDGSCSVLPLTFNIDGLIYNKKNYSNSKDIDIKTFTNGTNLKFSPFWDENFILWYYLSNIPEFNEDKKYYDAAEFKNSAQGIKNMLENSEEIWDLKLFNEKYMHLSPQLLVASSLIDYYFFNLSDYLMLAKEYRDNISFSFLSSNGLIPVRDEMIFIGINNISKKSKEAAEIISWMFNVNNQKKFIEDNYKKHGMFPLFNGELSTLKDVTKKTITEYYPILKHLIPQTDIITTPMNLPPLWNSLKSGVFKPMFNEILTIPENLWDKKYAEYYGEWFKRHNK